MVDSLGPQTLFEYTIARTGIRTNGYAATFSRLARNAAKSANDSRQVHQSIFSAADVLQNIDEAFADYEKWERRSARVRGLATDLDSRFETSNELDQVFAIEIS
jgi:hypothetical protein